jgi:hypothetical protein
MTARIRQALRAIGFRIIYFCEDRPRLRGLATRIWVTFLARSEPPPQREENLKRSG